jgi:drug/metabolite transporter (DMT)-like permease
MSATTFGIVLVLLSTAVEGFGQTFLKKSAIDLARRHRWIALGVLVLIVEVLLYSGGLRYLAVSTAFPITSISFVIVTLMSRWLLGEKVTPVRWAGTALILIGTIMIVAYAA